MSSPEPQSCIKPKVLGLFSGAGGLDLGFSLAGFEVVVSSDIEQSFLDTIHHNSRSGTFFSKKHKVICGDISKLEPTELYDSSIDFIIGGPPCQSFSAAGRRAGGVFGVNDFRGSLFWHYCRMIQHFSPKGFLFENVRGLLQANGGADWKVIRSAFERLGYHISYRVLDAADYGVPQHRERVIVVGARVNEFHFPRPTHGRDSSRLTPHVSTGEAIGDLDCEPDQPCEIGGKWGGLLAEVPPGQNYLHFTEEMGHPAPVFGWRSRFSDFLYKLDPSRPSKTIVASQGKYGGPFHWRNRKLTLAEYKRLQSFPDSYEFSGPYNLAVKQLGNSVAPRFAQSLADAVLQQIFECNEKIELIHPAVTLQFDHRKREKAKRTRAARAVRETNLQQLSLLEAQTPLHREMPRQEQHVWHYSHPRKRIATPNGSIFELELSGDGFEFDVVISEAAVTHLSSYSLELHFSQSSSHTIRRISVSLLSSSIRYACVAWDAVDFLIARETSFPNIQPLYGHFTEPHPKFGLTVRAEDDQMPGWARFVERTADRNFLSKVRPAGELNVFFPDRTLTESIRTLRDAGWDVRSHETNRAIADGLFRACYPFTMSLNAPRFVVWREDGRHKTADHTSIPEEQP